MHGTSLRVADVIEMAGQFTKPGTKQGNTILTRPVTLVDTLTGRPTEIIAVSIHADRHERVLPRGETRYLPVSQFARPTEN